MKITTGAAAAVLADGSVAAWGHPAFGGECSECSEVQDQLRNVHLQSTPSAFAAILANGSVFTWVNSTNGGDSSSVQNQLTSVQQVHATESAFAAILANSSVVTWGTAYEGGDSSSVQHLRKDVKQIQRSNVAFAAILGDGSVVTWGVPIYGDSSVQDQLRDFTAAGVHLQRSVTVAKLPPRGRHGHHVWWRKLGRKIRPVCIGPQLHSYAYSCGFALAVVRKQQKSRVILMRQVGFPSFCH